MKDASGHEHDDKGLFTSSGDGVTPASELKKKSVEELANINSWDDEKTRKMKMKLAKMHAKNGDLKDEIARRKAHIAEMKKDLGINKAVGDLAAGETVPGVQLCPFGEYQGQQRLQVCDRQAFEQVIADWREGGAKEILMDFEHKSEVGKIDSDTRAAAWIANLAIDDERGLVGDLKFTDEGADAVANRRLRFLSPVWPLDEEGRPTHLKSVALTNTPNIPVAPVLNKAQPGEVNVEDTKENENMDKIKEALGLAPEASEEDVLNAVTALVQKNKDAETAALEKEADEFAEANKAKLDPKVCKAQYIANKEACKALVAAIPEAKKEEPQVILNKGKEPTKKLAKADAVAELNKCKTPQEKIAYAQAHAAELSAAE